MEPRTGRTADDRAVIAAILAGDRHAFAALVERHQAKGMALAMRMLHHREEAEEALQDAFVRAFHALPRFEQQSAFATWFYRILYNVCLNASARRDPDMRSLHQRDGEEGESFEVPSSDPLPNEWAERSEVAAILDEEIRDLPAAYGPTFTMFFVQELSYDEIVEITGLPLGTVKARIFRARMHLRTAVIRRLGAYETAVLAQLKEIPT